MDGADAFLTLARSRTEFSSLRRSKWSTLCMLVSQAPRARTFVYTCNECKHHGDALALHRVRW